MMSECDDQGELVSDAVSACAPGLRRTGFRIAWPFLCLVAIVNLAAIRLSGAIGFIALFGFAVMDGIIILSQYNQLIDEGFDRVRAVIRTGELQLRPVLMTCVVAGVGLLPAAMSAGIGSQVQKPLAVVVVTGMMLAPLVILVTLPVLISFFSRRAR